MIWWDFEHCSIGYFLGIYHIFRRTHDIFAPQAGEPLDPLQVLTSGAGRQVQSPPCTLETAVFRHVPDVIDIMDMQWHLYFSLVYMGVLIVMGVPQ